jgi:hypothetical protein
MKPIVYLICNLMVLAYGIYAASVHGATSAWLIVLASVVVGLAMSGKFGFGSGQPHRISWRRTFLHGRIRPEIHRHW